MTSANGLNSAPAGSATQRFGIERLYPDARSMAAASVVNALLGIAFWGLAARLFPPHELGVMTAVLAVIVSVGVVVAGGVGDAYTALLPAVGSARPQLYRRGQTLFLLVAVSSAVIAGIVTVLVLSGVRGSIGVVVLVVVGIVAWSTINVQTSTLVALGRARWLPAVNIAISVAKIGLLPLFAVTVAAHSVELAFVISAGLMVIILQPVISRLIRQDHGLPPAVIPVEGSASARMFDRFFAQSIASTGLSLGLLTVTPFLVTAFAGPGEGALYALSLSVVQVLDLVGMAMTVSLVVHASSVPAEAERMARAVLIRALAIVIAGALAITAVAPVALRWLNHQYGAMGAGGVIAALCATCVVRTVYTVWAGLERSRRNVRTPLLFNIVFAVVLLAAMPEMCAQFGAVGGALATLFAQCALTTAATIHFLVTRRTGGVGARGRGQGR